MLPTPFETFPFPSSYSLPASRCPPAAPASPNFDSSLFSSFSALIETQDPAISQIFDCAVPSSSDRPMPFRAASWSSSTTLEQNVENMAGVSDTSLKFPSSTGSSSSNVGEVGGLPLPLELLQSSTIPPFLSKTYKIVNDPSLDSVVSWGSAGQSFVVWDPVEFSMIVLPRHFKHNNFSSFVRQLSTYGFRKIDTDRWEFANEQFLRGKRFLLKNINRQRSSRAKHIGSCLGSSMDMELSGTEDELQRLRSGKYMLMQDVVKMKQEHLAMVKRMDALSCRVYSAEVRQKKMTSFWTKVLRNPVFLMQLKQRKKQREIASTSIKRFLKQEQPTKSDVNRSTTHQKIGESTSTAVLQGLESCLVTQLPDHLLEDMPDKLGLDVNKQDGSSNKSFEISEPSLIPNASIKGKKNIMISKEEASLNFTDFYTSSPKESSSAKMILRPMSPLSNTFNGSSAGEIQDAMACRTQYLSSSSNDISQEQMFSYSLEPLGEADDSFSSAHDVWDNLVCTNPEIPGVEIEHSARWDYGLHSDEGFDIEKCFGGKFPLLQHMGEVGHGEDHPKASKP